MPAIFRKIWKWFAAGVAGVVILLAILLGLFRLMLPQVPAYHAQIEGWASRAIGLPVEIDRIDARWGLDGPELRFSGARVLAPNGELPLLEADTGTVSISVLEWLKSREIRTDRVMLDGTRLTIVRTEGGRYHLLGLETPGDFSVDLIPDGRFELREVQVTLEGLPSQESPWSFDSPSTTIEKEGHKLALAGGLALPDSLGGALTFSGEVIGELGGDRDLEWKAKLEGPDLVLGGWREFFPGSPYVPAEGAGAVQLELAFVGTQLQSGNARVSLNDLRIPGAADGETGYETVEGKFRLERNDGGWRGAASELLIVRNQRMWPPASVSLEWSRGQGGSQTYMDASFLRLEDLTPLVRLLPPEEELELLEELSPVGDLRGLVIHHQSKKDVVSYTVQSELYELGFNATRDWPGLAGVTGLLRSSEQGGRVQIASAGMSVDVSTLFNRPIKLTAAEGPLVWQRTAQGTFVSSEGLDLDSTDYRATISGSLNIPIEPDSSPLLELSAVVQDADMSQARYYMPAKKMGPKVAAWLDQAFVRGRVPEARVTFNGPLKAFPFDQGQGLFTATFSVEDVTLRYGRNWPAITGLDADVEFENAGLTVTGSAGSTETGGRIKAAIGRIPDLRAGELEIEGTASAELTELLQFMRSSPLTDFFGRKLAEVEVHEGEGEVEVDLQFPLRHLQDRRFQVDVGIRDGAIGLRERRHRLEDIVGDVSFFDDKVVAEGVSASMFQQPVDIEIGPSTGAQEGTLATMTGWIDAENVVTELGLPLDEKIEGETAWQTRAVFIKKEGVGIDLAAIRVESNLQGMAVSLPAPFQKTREEKVPLSLDFTLGYDETVDLRAGWGADVEARFQLGQRFDTWRLERGAIQFGEGRPRLPITEGVVVRGAVEALPVGEWLDLRRGGEGSWRMADYLNSVNLEVSELRALGYRFPSVELSLDKASREWVVRVRSGTVDGTLFVPFEVPGELPLIVDMERLYLNEADGTESEFGDPRELPGLQIAVEDFMLGGRKFGRIHVEGTRTPQGLDFERLSTEAESFSIEGSGSWLLDDTGQQTRLDLELLSNDVLLTLSDLGYGHSIEASSGQAIFNVYWPGAPGGDFLPSVSGNVSVAVEDGQLNDVEPGAGRVFGLLSISALPRRLGLDFRDVFRKGFRFDDINGDFVLDQGDAYTANLRLDGPAAEIGVVGRAGLASRDYDQTAIVSAKIGKTLPVAGAIAAGPGVGAALLLFSEIFKKPLGGIARAHYRIKGSWDEPDIERVLARDRPDEDEDTVEQM